MPKRSAASFVEIKVRVRARLHEKLAAEVRRGKTSLAAEVTKRLERSFDVEAVNSAFEAVEARLGSVEARLNKVLGQLEQRSIEVGELELTMAEMFKSFQRQVVEGMAVAKARAAVLEGLRVLFTETENEAQRAVTETENEAKHAG